MSKLNYTDYFLKLADVVSERSSCCKSHYGAVIVKQHRILSTGYNGTPAGWVNCDEGGCIRCNGDAPHGEQYEYCSCVHAETNAVLAAARFGVELDGSTLYTQEFPCDLCVKELVQCGIINVVYRGGTRWIN